MLTQVEWAKLHPHDHLAAGVVEIFARENPIMLHMPYENIAGGAYVYNIEDTLPGIAFRSIGESYVESTGVVNPQTEALKILGGDLDLDVAHVAWSTGVNDTRAIHDAMKTKALALTHLKTFFDGDETTNPKEFDGLNARLTGAQVISAGTNGAVLTLDMLDDLCDAVSGEPTILLMNKKMRQQVRKLARSVNALTISKDDLGREVDLYYGTPFGIIEDDATGTAILGFDETQGTANNATSIYACRFAPETLHGIQTAPISVRDLGELDSKPAMRTRVEHYSAFVVKHPRASARLKGVKLA